MFRIGKRFKFCSLSKVKDGTEESKSGSFIKRADSLKVSRPAPPAAPVCTAHLAQLVKAFLVMRSS